MQPVDALAAPHLAWGLATVVASALGLALGWGLRGRRRRARLLRVRRSSIAAAPGGLTRIRGRVHVLAPAEGSERSAAYAGIDVRWDGPRLAPLAPLPLITVERREAAGRFVVSDGTGLAIVRPGAFELLVGDAAPSPPTAGIFHLLDGMEVELAGYAARVEATLDPLRTPGSFEGCLPTLRFDGSEDAPLTLWVRGAPR